MALAAMGSHQGPEVEVLRSSLKKEKHAAEQRPLKVQSAHTDAFIERARLRKIGSRTRRRDGRRGSHVCTIKSPQHNPCLFPVHPYPIPLGIVKVAQMEANLSTSQLDVADMEVSQAVHRAV